MSERKYKTVKAILRRGVITEGMIVGVTSSRIPMIEFECDKVMPCVQFLINPKVVYDRIVEESCKVVNRLVEAYLELQFAFAVNRYNLKEGEIWKAFPRKRSGEYAAPIIVNAGNKSIHVIGMIKVHLDKLDDFVAMLRALDCVDSKYLDMVLLKREFTLRLSGKDKYGFKPITPVVVAEVIEANTNRWIVDAKVSPRAFLLADRWLYTFRRHGMDVMIRYLD
ncbi:MAG: hypothetical protein JHC26_04470 [Thermofilum sp.]|jgi:hypothetical protein|uniref:hypothetical protein n=1 Tax=Thermofilum sp. TaxID=1961369 RepID=UPI00258CDE37|nr:hypothetical protein [Thermofilum sp.]MCI4408322.1 hypothetical protein [Thermofilum sp.]